LVPIDPAARFSGQTEFSSKRQPSNSVKASFSRFFQIDLGQIS
jgi:hypothetical protein